MFLCPRNSIVRSMSLVACALGTTLLITALKWLKNNGMKEGWVTPWNSESELATQRAINARLKVLYKIETE
jgi:hypothetical protein